MNFTLRLLRTRFRIVALCLLTISALAQQGQKTITVDPFTGKTQLTSPRPAGGADEKGPVLPPTQVTTPRPHLPRPPSTNINITEGYRAPTSQATPPSTLRPLATLADWPVAVTPQDLCITCSKTDMQPPALRYTIELRDYAGQWRSVDPARGFRAREQIRIRFESSIEGRVLIVQKLATGYAEVLYPVRRETNLGARDWMRAGFETIMPQGGCFEFEDTPEDITLMVTVAGRTARSLPQVSDRERLLPADARLFALRTYDGSKRVRVVFDNVLAETRVHTVEPWFAESTQVLALEIHLRQVH